MRSGLKADLLVEEHRGSHRAQMPQAMGIQAAQPRREVQQLQAHGEDDPGHGQARPHGPGPARRPVLVPAEPAPHDVLDDAHHDVRCHVVRVVPGVALQVDDMPQVEAHAEERPGTQHRRRLRAAQIQAEDPNRRVV